MPAKSGKKHEGYCPRRFGKNAQKDHERQNKEEESDERPAWQNGSGSSGPSITFACAE